ncbi:MAG: MarR family transcriptional regulator [Erysipelothrix sp.]|nr:MarR family transcriptional regulator [Erysipelothrix sp.]
MDKIKVTYGKVNNQNLRLLITLSKTTQNIHKRSADIFIKHKLTTSQFSALESLYHKGSMSINKLTESALSTSGNMTVVINNLLKAGLVSRSVNPKDKRSSLIKITNQGRQKVEDIFPIHLIDLSNSFKLLNSEEKQLLIRLLNKIEK